MIRQAPLSPLFFFFLFVAGAYRRNRQTDADPTHTVREKHSRVDARPLHPSFNVLISFRFFEARGEGILGACPDILLYAMP